MVEENQQSIWNFDGAELYELFGIKQKIIFDLDGWNLEAAYWGVRSLRRELDAKLRRKEKKLLEKYEMEKNKGKKTQTEKERVDSWITSLNESRLEYFMSSQTEEDKVKFYYEIESTYMKLCHLMKKHGLYFREGEDNRLAVLRR